MAIKQISIFIENKEGRIKKAISILGEKDINIRALSIADTTKYGILRLIVSDNVKAMIALEEKGFVVRENDVVIVSVPDKPNGLNSVLEVLDEKDINLEYMYAFISNKTDEAIVVMWFENMEEAVELLKDSDVNILEKEDIEKL